MKQPNGLTWLTLTPYILWQIYATASTKGFLREMTGDVASPKLIICYGLTMANQKRSVWLQMRTFIITCNSSDKFFNH